MAFDPIAECIGFEWDDGNAVKNWERYQVTPEEAEDVFFNDPLIVQADLKLSTRERRYRALGQTTRGRLLFLAFIVRKKLIRVVSVRDMNRKESESYERTEKNS
jgi:uncharacterized DUF497 family protein